MRGLVAKTTGPVVMIKGCAWIIRKIRVIRRRIKKEMICLLRIGRMAAHG